MSATLAPELVERLAELLGGAAVVTSQGRSFHVEVRHSAPGRRLLRAAKGFEGRGELERTVAKAACEALRETDGDVLCFLPGEREIMRTAKAVTETLPSERAAARAQEAKAQKKKPFRGFGAAPPATKAALGPVDVVPLHGALDKEAQDCAVQRGPSGRRRVVLATNIAEASITVEGVTAVVDAGLRRVSKFSRATGFDALDTVAISQASADQRAGRAGRLRDGLCLRLWSKDEKLQAADVPAIAQVDLTGMVLSLAACGVPPAEIPGLPWLDAPPAASLQHAEGVLQLLGAMEGGEGGASITTHGREMALLPLHPRLGHMALRSGAIRSRGPAGGEAADVADLCALLEEDRDVLRGSSQGGGPAAPGCADVRPRLRALRSGGVAGMPTGPGGVRPIAERCAHVRRASQALRRQLPSSAAATADPGLLLALAFPERVARRSSTNDRFVLRDGSSCQVEDAALREENFLAIARVRQSKAMLAAPLAAGDAAAFVLPG